MELGPTYYVFIKIVGAQDVTYGETVKIYAVVLNDGITVLDGGNLSTTVDGKNISVGVFDGIGIIEIPDLDADEYNVEVRYEKGDHGAKTETTFTVNPKKFNIGGW